MKKWLSLSLSVMLVFVYCAFALASSEGETKEQGNTSVVKEEYENEIGDYSVVIDSCRLAKDYEGKKIAIVKYIFTNNLDDDGAAFYSAFDDKVYQNGVGLNKSYFIAESANYSSDNQAKSIKKGASIEVEVAYELNDETTDIEVELSQLFSFDDSKITKTFSIK